MKIALIGTNKNAILNFRKSLIKLLGSQGHEVFLFATDLDENSKKVMESWGARPIAYSLSRSGLNPIGDIISTFKLIKKLKEISPDITLNYFSKPVIFGGFAAYFAKVPRRVGMLEGLGFTFTNLPNQTFRQRLKKKVIKFIQIFLYKLSIPLYDEFIVLNPDDKKDLIDKCKIRAKEVKILGGIGVDLDFFYETPVPIDRISFLFIGRLLASKGIYEFTNVAKRVKQKYPEVQFDVLGELDLENPESLKKEELDILINSGAINYLGYKDKPEEVRSIIQNSSAFVLLSSREGVPRSTQEVMAVGRAIITTDVPGCRETVIHDKNGFLIKSGSRSTKDLETGIIDFIENPKKLKKFGKESRRIAQERFDSKKQDRLLLSIIIGTKSSSYN